MTTLLHINSENSSAFARILNEVLWNGILDTVKLIPFLFLTYLLMEYIEHRASSKFMSFMKGAGPFGPLLGAGLGIIPQCGFSVSAASLYTGRVISFGTLLAVFLSTSDEMIPILAYGKIPAADIAVILLYKAAVAIIIGYLFELIFRIFRIKRQNINIDEICENDNCHCEKGIFYSAIHHTATISIFVLIITLILNAVIFFVGEEKIGGFINSAPLVSHAVCTLVGLIPNCAASVLLSTLYADGIISAGAMISGLFSGAGVGLIVLFRLNKHYGENLAMLAALIMTGFVFGVIFDLLPLI